MVTVDLQLNAHMQVFSQSRKQSPMACAFLLTSFEFISEQLLCLKRSLHSQ